MIRYADQPDLERVIDKFLANPVDPAIEAALAAVLDDALQPLLAA